MPTSLHLSKTKVLISLTIPFEITVKLASTAVADQNPSRVFKEKSYRTSGENIHPEHRYVYATHRER